MPWVFLALALKDANRATATNLDPLQIFVMKERDNAHVLPMYTVAPVTNANQDILGFPIANPASVTGMQAYVII